MSAALLLCICLLLPLSCSEVLFDIRHMSTEGAAVFTKAFCDILKKAETGDASRCFYESYTDMKIDSPYLEYLC